MTAPEPHLDLDALADSLVDEAGDDARAHLRGCASCASRLAELQAAEVGLVATLAALPPPPVPADLADRLSAALAAEPALASRRTASVTALPAAPRRRPRNWLPAAAAGVLLLSGAGLGLALTQGGSSDDTAAETSAAGGAADTAAPAADGLLLTATGTDWADAAAVEQVLPSVLSGAAARVQLDAQAPSDEADVSILSADDGLARLRTPEGLASCLSAVLPPDEPDVAPLAVDYATYDGQPALAVVLPDPDPAQVSVFVVGAGCSAGDDGTLLFRRLPRG